MWDYVELGFLHVLPEGLDHLLFVMGISLGSAKRWKRLMLELGSFTLAHTVALFLGAMRWVVLPSGVTELLIAASIVAIGLENLFGAKQRSRALTVFCFGLLHGQGFAGALLRLRIPDAALVPSLLAFNVGVELAQVCAAAATVLGLAAAGRNHRARLERGLAWVVIGVGLFWMVERAL